ncbi:MAG: hypothetical protein QXO56_03170 [Candidatus Pacearchaeota archaeon]
MKGSLRLLGWSGESGKGLSRGLSLIVLAVILASMLVGAQWEVAQDKPYPGYNTTYLPSNVYLGINTRNASAPLDVNATWARISGLRVHTLIVDNTFCLNGTVTENGKCAADMGELLGGGGAGGGGWTLIDGNLTTLHNVAITAKLTVDSLLNETSDPDEGAILSLHNSRLPLDNGDTRFLDFGSLNNKTAFIRAVGRNLTILGGNVGIGTTSPGAKLHIVTDGSTRAIRISGTNSSQYAEIQMAGDQREYRLGVGGSDTSVANKFYLWDNNAKQFRMVIDPSGNVGIGTTSPGAKLDVNGTIDSGKPNLLRVGNSTYPALVVNGTTGNVGIGTTSPAYKLDVAGIMTTRQALVIAGSGPGGGYPQEDRWYIYQDSSKNLHVARNGWDPVIFINRSNNNVGIGTTSPQAKLDVNGSLGIIINNKRYFLKPVFLNLGEDSYTLIGSTLGGEEDSCDSNRANSYTCDPSESKSCTDIRAGILYPIKYEVVCRIPAVLVTEV